MLDSFVRMVAERPETFSVYFRERAHLAAEHRDAATEVERRIVAELRRLYVAGVTEGRLREIPDEAAVFGLLGMCFWTYEWFRADGRLTPEALSDAIRTLAAHGAVVPR